MLSREPVRAAMQRTGRPPFRIRSSRGLSVIEEFQSYLLFFLGAWWIALIALVAGAFGGRHSQRLVASPLVMLIIFIQVWVVVALAKLAFGYVGYLMELGKNVQAIYPEFVMPLAAGIYLARQLLRLDAQKHGRLRADTGLPPPRRRMRRPY
jgi:hypothetical protein